MVNTVEELLRNKSILYTHAGKDFIIKCLNPDHEDNNPSLRIDKISGIGHCFSCGFKLNLFNYYGILYDNTSIKVLKLKEKIEKIYSSMNGLEFPKGIIPWNKDFRGISAKTLTKYEAFTVLSGEFENRIVFPLRDISGRIVCFIGRHIFSEGKEKYLIKPGKISPPLFPSNFKPIANSIILVEGIFDALNLIDKGLNNVICVFGTSTISEENYKEKLRDLKLQGITKIFIMFDGDKPGFIAANRILPLLENMEFLAEIIELEEDTDPGNLTENDIQALKKLLWPELL